MQPETKAAMFYISIDTYAFLPLEKHGPHGIPLSPPNYEELPEAPQLHTEETKTESPKIPFERTKTLSPEAFLMEAHSIRSSNAKLRTHWAQDVEKKIAPKILQKIGFTNIQEGNGRPVDLEAWYNGTRYLIDVKYTSQMPSLIRKLATHLMNNPLSGVKISKTRGRTKKEAELDSDDNPHRQASKC